VGKERLLEVETVLVKAVVVDFSQGSFLKPIAANGKRKAGSRKGGTTFRSWPSIRLGELGTGARVRGYDIGMNRQSKKFQMLPAIGIDTCSTLSFHMGLESVTS
jgi:hypothetical protein